MYSSIIVDGNNLFEKHYYVAKTQKEGLEIAKSTVLGFLHSLEMLERKYTSGGVGKIYIIFDNHNSQADIRKEIDPEYKGNRSPKDKVFLNALKNLQMLLQHYKDNYWIIYRSFYEADDLVKPLILELEKDSILIVSEDMDWSRLIEYDGRRIHWLAKGRIFNSDSFVKEYEFLPSESNVTLWKTFRGDSSDNIPVGVPGIRKKIILKLMEDFTDIYDILLKSEDLEYTGIWGKRIQENKARLRLNYQLLSFVGITKEKMKEFMHPCTFNSSVLRVFYETLDIDPERHDPRYEKVNTNSLEEFFKFRDLKRV